MKRLKSYVVASLSNYLCSPLIDLDLEEEDEVSFTALDYIPLLSDFDEETSDEDNDFSGNVNEVTVWHANEASVGQTGHPSSTDGPRTQEQPLRNGPVIYPLQTIDVLPLQTWYLRPGDTVELHPEQYSSESHPNRKSLGDFLYVQNILENIETGEKYLRGLRLRRTRYVNGLNKNLNELCLVLQEDEDDLRDVFAQGAVEIPVDQILRPRNLTFSSKDFPQDSFREILTTTQAQFNLEIQNCEQLVCRWVFIETFESATKRKKLKGSASCLRRLITRECNGDSFINCMSNRMPANHHTTDSRGANRPRIRRQKYTYGSGFCGAGGDALGAKWAGLDIRYGFDSDFSACASFRRNFPGTEVFCCQAADFPPNGFDPRVHILHLSFPCKYFSPNHTKEGKDDEANTTVIFNLKQLLLKAKPPYHTQENTFGLKERHEVWLGAMINMIIEAGYNVRWKVFKLADFGLPAQRQRLVIYAARRGYPLPNFPSPTHGEHNRRHIYEAISNIPPSASWHLDEVHWLPHPKAPYDARTTLAKCICTDGGNNYHPSGQRAFSPRELACIQTVPWNFDFCGSKTNVVKQIGNLLPPAIWKIFLEQVLKTLDDFLDGFIDDIGNPIQDARQAESFEFSTSSNVGNSRHRIPLVGNPHLPRFSRAQAGPSLASATTSTNVDRVSAPRRNCREIVIIDDEEDDDIVVVQLRNSREIVDLTEE